VLQRQLTAARASKLCWFPSTSSPVTIDVGRQLIAHVSGINRCGSSWSCPVCAPVVRQGRAQEIDEGLNAFLAQGGGAELCTLTCSHQLQDVLEPRLAAMAGALKSLLKGAAWERFKKRLGFVGTIRAVEVTWGEANGWHPHNHVVMLFERPLSDQERQELWRWLHNRWAGVLRSKGLGSITEAHGVDLRPVTGDVLGEYLTKVEGGWTAGLELARGDAKGGKRGGITPFEILAQLAVTGEVEWRDLWTEYETATFGKVCIRWSPGLRARLLPKKPELTDEQMAASEGADEAFVRWLCQVGEWREMQHDGTTGLLLDQVEDAAGWVIWLCDLFGQELRPVETKRERPRVKAPG
jgi:hypothetical protein